MAFHSESILIDNLLMISLLFLAWVFDSIIIDHILDGNLDSQLAAASGENAAEHGDYRNKLNQIRQIYHAELQKVVLKTLSQFQTIFPHKVIRERQSLFLFNLYFRINQGLLHN